ncbi:MAG: SLBB domain-containing protein [Gammaproteobacteria bacterium]|nr:MAG: SLBB domain-containing protein [Gammaproteobacteria bacterium]
MISDIKKKVGWIARVVVTACLVSGTVALVSAESLTEQQLQRLERLTPEQRAALLESQQQGLERLTPEQRAAVKKRLQTRQQLPVAPIPPADERRVGSVKRGEPGADTLGSLEMGTGSERESKPEPDGSERLPLPRFGYDLFADVPTTFAPADGIPVDVDYAMGPGDTVLVQLFGKEHAEYSLVVTREGSLQFPKIGPISVAGLTFREMKEVLKAHIEEQMIGEKVVITLGKLRSIRVFILGDVKRPGSYTVSALSTMTNALFVGGGVKPIGSLRKIQLKRRGEVVARLDLYDLLLHGDTRHDVRLQPGDVIFVPPVGATLGLAGEVRRPAIYELRDERSVGQVLTLAGGLLPTAYPQASQIERINEHGERTLIDLDAGKKAGLQAAVQDGDVLRIFSVLEKMENIVLLSGHAQRPGGYQWHPGMRITDLIASIENDLLPRPDLDYALIKRELAPDHRIELFSVRPGEALQNPASAENVELEARDELILFGSNSERSEIVEPLVDMLSRQATYRQPARVVRAAGLVRHPGEYPLEKGMRVSDLIRAGGGLAEAAYALGAELTRYVVIDGNYREVGHIKVGLAGILEGTEGADLILQPYDDLRIKRLPEWEAAATVEIKGEVRFPGIYPIARGEQLSKLLERAGGLTDIAFAHGTVFLREELRKREKLRLEELSRRLETDLAGLSLQLAQEDSGKVQSLDFVRALGSQLRAIEPTGRLVINLSELLNETKDGRRSELDVTLQDGDRLYIPPLTQEVTVTGEVFYPTSHLYRKGTDRKRYVEMSGGVTRKADSKYIYVVRADGSVDTSGGWFSVSGEHDIQPGDTIVVPLNVDLVRPIARLASISKIIFQLAVAAVGAKAVGVF